jgi:copper(I)-binding protein
MKMTRTPLPLLLLSLCLLSLAACASDRNCAPQVRDGWVRMPPGPMSADAMSMMAGFGRIENRCPMPATIVSASSPAFGDTSLHETRIVDGISRRRPVPDLRIAPDDAAVLTPGGLHLMLMQPRAPLKAGSKVAVEFKLQDGRTLLGEFEVRGADAP